MMSIGFVGTRSDCKAFLRSRSGHYVYILRRPDGRPFYVGKGVGDRVFQHENEARHPNDRRSNAHKLNVIRAIWRAGDIPSYEIDFMTDDPREAYAREAALISELKRLHEGGPLTNRAPGGGSTAGPAPASVARHSATLGGIPDDNPERAILNRFVLAIAPMDSVVVKPVSQFVARPTVKFLNKTRTLSMRQAVALVAAAAANGINIDAACGIPRRLIVDGVEGLVENGVACDLLTSQTVTIAPAPRPGDEVFSVSTDRARAVVGMIGRKKCVDLGVIVA